MSMPSLSKVLLTQTGGDNAAFTTVAIDTRDYDFVTYSVTLIGGVAPAGLAALMTAVAEDGATSLGAQGATITTGATIYLGGWGPGCTGSSNLPNGGFAQAVPPFMKFTVPAFGLGITARITVWGRRNHRGPDVHVNAD